MCLKRFLSDNTQQKYRRIAQIQSVKHEDAIIRYKNIFLKELSRLENYKCENCTGICIDNPNEDCIHQSLIELFSYKDELNEIFDTIHDIYIKWINSLNGEASEKFDELLTKFDC